MTGLTDDFWKQSPISQQTPTPDVVGIAPELVERMVAMVRLMASKSLHEGWIDYAEARAIVALLPEPVDGDEALVIKLAGAIADRRGVDHTDRTDGMMSVWRMDARAVLEAYRALERGEA